MKIFLLTLSIIAFQGLRAQSNLFTHLSTKKANSGQIHIFQTAEIKTLMGSYVKEKKNEKGIQGYRVQVFFGSGHLARENANNIRNAFVSTFKDIPVHVVFEDPYFKVRVGDFRTKSEALEVLVRIKDTYEGAYIVKDYIEFPKLD